MSIRRSLLLAGLAALSACADPALEKRVADLEAQVKELQTKGPKAGPPGAPGAEAGVDPAKEQAAAELFRQANEMAEAGNYDGAKGKLAELTAQYGDTRAAKRSSRLSSELAVVGSDAGDLAVDKWFAGQAAMGDGKATLLVFFEEWCPHCQREVPKMQATYTKYKGQGLNVIGLTKVTRSATDEKVDAFIKQHEVTYPVAKEKGDLSERFGVSGIPAAAVVKNGKVVWRGHPARLTDQMVEGWLNG